jgi:N-acetylglucosamine-6-phosphate deacetylase
MEFVASSCGAIDLQINGALGVSFNDLNQENHRLIPKICDLLWEQGVDGFLPTLVTTSIENYHRSLFYLSQYVNHSLPHSAQIFGIHLEGPFLHPDKRGAHPLECLLPLTPDTVQQVMGEYSRTIKLITLAPELDENGTTIRYLRELGILVSMGHSTANEMATLGAIVQGANMITHTFNAMPSLHHRSVNLLTEALVHDQLYCGAIADGVHVHPKMLKLLYRLKRDKLFLVSDALAPYGLADGEYGWDQRTIRVVGGTARLLDGTLAGTTQSLWKQVMNLVEWGICDLQGAIATVTTTPAQILGINLMPSLHWYQLADGRFIHQRFSQSV